MSNLFEWSDDVDESYVPIPQADRTEALGAVADLAYTEGPFFSVLKLAELYKAEYTDDRPEISVEKLNEMYPDLPEAFQEPKKPSVAAIIANRQRLRKEIETKASMGPNDWTQSGLSLGTGFLYGMMDPLSVATGAAAEVALFKAANSARIAQIASQAGLAGKSAKAVQGLGKAGIGAEFARDVTAGVGEGLLTEGVVALSASEDMTPYTTEDYFMNTVGGALLAPALFGGVRLAARAISPDAPNIQIPPELEIIKAKDPQMTVQLQAAAKLAAEAGVKPDVEAILKIKDQELLGSKPSFVTHEGRPLDFNQPKVGGVLYGAVNPALDSGPLSVYLGDGLLYLTDSPQIANGVAGSQFGSSYPKVAEFELDDLNIAKFTDEIEPGKTVGQKVQEIQKQISAGEATPEALTGFYSELKAKGYDGIGGNAKDFDPGQTQNHGVVALFDKPEPRGVWDADTAAIGDTSKLVEEQRTKAYEETSSIDPQARNQIDELIAKYESEPKFVEEIEDYNKLIDEKIQEIELASKVGAVDDELLKQVERLKEAKKETALVDQTFKAATACLGIE